MKTYSVRIEEDKPRNATIDKFDSRPGFIAECIIEEHHVREGAHVRFATVEFDHPTDAFRVVEFAFDVKDGKAANLTTVRH